MLTEPACSVGERTQLLPSSGRASMGTSVVRLQLDPRAGSSLNRENVLRC